MMMKLYEALKTIKDECSAHTDCINCPFSIDNNGCGITLHFPDDWQIKKPTFKLFEEGEE